MTTAAKGSLTGELDVYDPACPTRKTLEHITSRWGVLALAVLAEDAHRFAELRRRLAGVSEKVLAETLRTLERDGFLLRQVLPGPASRVQYCLSAQGRETAQLVGQLVDLLERQMPEVLAHQADYDGYRPASQAR